MLAQPAEEAFRRLRGGLGRRRSTGELDERRLRDRRQRVVADRDLVRPLGCEARGVDRSGAKAVAFDNRAVGRARRVGGGGGRRRVLGAVGTVAVLVVAAAGLAAEPARLHHPRLDRMGLPAWLVEALGVERLRDLEVDVDADQVGELERAHAETAADPDDPVDLLDVRYALAEQAQRLEAERPRHAVREESGSVGGANRLASHPPGELRRECERVLRALIAGHHLDQLDQHRRVEEMHADDALRVRHRRRDRGDREGGGVGGEHRPISAHIGQTPEQRALHLEVLGRRLDHELAPAEVLEQSRDAQPPAGDLRVRRAPSPALGALREPLAHAPLAGLERLRGGVVEVGLESAEAGELCDPRSHRPGAGDADPVDQNVRARPNIKFPAHPHLCRASRSRSSLGRLLALPELNLVALEEHLVHPIAGSARWATEGAQLSGLGPDDDVRSDHLADDQDPDRPGRCG